VKIDEMLNYFVFCILSCEIVIVLCLFDELCELKHLIFLIEGVLTSIVGVLIVGGIILLIVLILRKKKKKQRIQQQIEEIEIDNNPSSPTTSRQSDTQYSPILKMSQTESFKNSQPLASPSNVELAKKHRIPFQDISVEKELGKGSYGKVCLGRWNGAPVALKFCKEKEDLEDFWKEANLMMYANHI
jgi:hypothetical protein